VINVSSAAHNFCRSPDFVNIRGPQPEHGKGWLYGRSKLANILFTKELVERYGITSYSLHPGSVKTELMRHTSYMYQIFGFIEPLVLMFFKTPWEGAQTTLYATLCDEKEVPSGSYLYDCEAVTSYNPSSYNETLQKHLWEISEKAVQNK
jgi:NAD(P)-dependent dehydrogenase (short-subunit alcohol dehydrogenase family)